MKDVFHSSGSKVLMALIFVMFGLMLYSSGSGDTLLSKAISFVSIPMQRVSTMVANNAAAAVETSGKTKEELAAENEELRAQINELNKKLVNYYTYQQENAQLRKYLGLKTDNPDYQPVAASVVGRDPNNIFGQFTIDQGTSSGIALNDPVVTEAGVVGWISAVSSTYSKVTTLLSPDTKISAMDKENQETGVIGCDIVSADAGIVKLLYLSENTAAAPGDIIVTSGVGGLYPGNLIVGTVAAVKHSETDVSLYAEVTPAVSVKDVRDVMVITSFQGQGEALETFGSSSSGGK